MRTFARRKRNRVHFNININDERSKNSFNGYLNNADRLFGNGEDDDAISMYSDALSTASMDNNDCLGGMLKAYFNLAELYCRKSLYPKAADCMEKAAMVKRQLLKEYNNVYSA
jgi:tetratricopeptide (TPR) repeat protein